MGTASVYELVVWSSQRADKMRAYINLETQQIRTLLELFAEIKLSRDWTNSEQYVHRTLLDALDRTLRGM
jgi:hypothetical protein